MVRDVGDFLADADDVIDDWESAADAASWSADGSHEYDTDGDYYLSRAHWMTDLLRRAISNALEQFAVLTEDLPSAWSTYEIATGEPRRPLRIIRDEAQLFIAPVGAPLPTAAAAEAWSRIRAVAFGGLHAADAPSYGQIPSYHAIGRAVGLNVAEPDASTADDDRPAVPRRRGLDAQRSPFGPQRRSH